MAKKKRKKTMTEITTGYEKFMKGKEFEPNKENLFNELLKSAVNKKGKKPDSK